MTQRQTPGEMWKQLRTAASSTTAVFACIPAEFVSATEPEQREQIASRSQDAFLRVPGLESFSRVGMYDFVGVSHAGYAALLDWAHRRSAIAKDADGALRWGFAQAGQDGLATIERLMGGTNEAARDHSDARVFVLGPDGWVRPHECRSTEDDAGGFD